jgi:hypothetical protein
VSLSLASWNVLADAYVKPEYYWRVDPAHLEPARRRAVLVERIAALARTPRGTWRSSSTS